MAKRKRGVRASDPAKSVTASLKLAGALLRADELKQAAKWAPAGLGENLPETV